MASLAVLIPDILAEIPGIPSFIAERQVLRATRVFTEETHAWRVNAQLSVANGVPTVNMTGILPANTELVDVISMKNVGGGEPVHPKTYGWLDKNTSNWRSQIDIAARYYVQDGNDTVRLVPTPASTTSNLYDVRLAVKPLLSATSIDDLLVNKFSEQLINGALAFLYQIPKKPWTDDGLAQYHKLLFLDSFSSARMLAAEEFQTGVARKTKYGGI